MVFDIKEKLVDVIASDSTIQALLGIVNYGDPDADPRIYWYYQGDAILDERFPAYITYALVGAGSPQATWNPTFSFNIWARTSKHAQAVATRLKHLVHKKTFSTGLQEFFCTIVHFNDIFQEQPKFAGFAVHIMTGYLDGI